MRPIRILLADGHQNVRTQVRSRLSRESEFEIVGEAASSERTVELVASVRPDVVLIDPIMPDGHGLLAISQISPQVAVIVLTAFSDTVMQMELKRMGVRHILDKGLQSERLVDAIRSVINPSS